MNDEFQRNLQQHHDAVVTFIELLVSEQALLADTPTPVDALARLTERKADQADALDTLDRQRRSLLDASGYTPDRNGGEAAAAQQGCTPLWQALLTQIATASTQNRINGLAIGNRLDHTNRTLSFLQRASGQTLYGPNGQAQSLARNQNLRGGV